MIDEIGSPQGLYPKHAHLLSQLAYRNVPYQDGEQIFVPTDISLPNYDVAIVIIAGGAHGERFTLGDGGAVLRSLDMQNYAVTEKIKKHLDRFLKNKGMRLIGNEIMTSPISEDHIAHLIPHVASVMQEAMMNLFAVAQKMEKLHLKYRIGEILNKIVDNANITHGYKVQGSTTDTYKFDFSISVPGRKRILLDAPVPDSSSIAATFLRQSDVKRLHEPSLVQMITYDPSDKWPSSALAQLKLVDVPLINIEGLRNAISFAA